MGGIEIIALFLILLAKAQKSLTPIAAANDSQAKANQAKAEASAAAAKGDLATAAQKNAEAAHHEATASSAAKAARTPPPWPQVVPAGLPPFPSGWRPASPVTGAMVSRAFQLLPQLWEHGEGTWKTEKTGDRWVTYRASMTKGPDGTPKRGVVAFTAIESAMPASADDAPQALAPAAPPTPRAPGQPSAIVPASHTTAPVATGLPLLQLTTPRMTGPSVVWVQQRLGLTADGTYGTGTAAAVSHYQANHGLLVDGKVGPHTWASLKGQQAAAA